MRARARPGARGLALGLGGLLLGACPGDDGPAPGPDPLFPDDYDTRYTEVRNCRGSGDHDLHNIRILVDAAALTPYEGRQEPFPVGSVVLKEEYDFGDLECSGEPIVWTVMQKLEPGSAPDDLDWAWQKVDADRRVVDEEPARCISCHQGCGVAPDGYDWTCSIPP